MRQLKYSFILLYLVFANLYAQNFNIINQNNIEVNKLEAGYHIYIQKNSETAGLKLKYKLEDGYYSYLYANNSLININNTSVHDNLGYVFETYLPETLHLYNNTQIKLRNNINLIFESYDIDGNILSESEIALKINNDRTNPIISLRNVEREGDLYAFYLYYSGANNGRYAFYVRDGKTNEAYKLIKTTYGNTINVDGSAIILEDTYNREIGKKLYIKAYFKEMPNDRYLSFNVFNNNRETFTYPIDYIIESTNKNIIDNTLKSINNVERIKNTSVQDDNDLKANIHKIIDKYNNGNPVDLIMVIDTTGSMKPYLRAIKSEIKTISKNIISKNENSRIGFMLYRDTKDKYLTKKIEFNNNIEEIERESKYFYADGGGDKAEPMYEAIQQALEKFEFQNENRVIVVITDAKPKVIGRANLELNTITAKRKNVNVEIISAKEMKEEDSDDYLYFLDF